MVQKGLKEVTLNIKCCDCGKPIKVKAWATEDPTIIPCERCWIEQLFYCKHEGRKNEPKV